jgi:hypothetical protein
MLFISCRHCSSFIRQAAVGTEGIMDEMQAYQECDPGYSSEHAPQNTARARISSGRSPCYQGSPHRGLLRSVKNFQSFNMICRKPHVASSICLRAIIFQNPEGTLWTHCIFELTLQYIPLYKFSNRVCGNFISGILIDNKS